MVDTLELFPPSDTPREDLFDVQRAIRDRAEFSDRRGPTGLPVDSGGVDQVFPATDTALSAAVSHRNGEWIERTYVRKNLDWPYIPGLLAFREGPVVVDAIRQLTREPDVILVDGNGRLHPREAGLATHVGVALDRPTIGVAKSLLCGTPRRDLTDLPAGAVVGIEADDDTEGSPDTVLGFALQSRQFEGSSRYVNPIYVSPGHRLAAETAVRIVSALCAGYKLPEPIRDADGYAQRAATWLFEGVHGSSS